ncbi:MAG: hypothetical protein ACJ8GN_06190 [Longimicrobiaceae bacterium]
MLTNGCEVQRQMQSAFWHVITLAAAVFLIGSARAAASTTSHRLRTADPPEGTMNRRKLATLAAIIAVAAASACSTSPTQVREPGVVRADGGLGMGSGNRAQPDSTTKTTGASNETTATNSGLGMGSGN